MFEPKRTFAVWDRMKTISNRQLKALHTFSRKQNAVEHSSPDVGTELTRCWGHPSPRVVDTLTNFPTRHILHYSCLFFKIFFPLFNKSNIMNGEAGDRLIGKNDK